MFKPVVLPLIALSFVSATVQASTIEEPELAYPNCYMEDGELKSSGEIYTYPFSAAGAWHGYFHITNISAKTLNVFMQFTDVEGKPYLPYQTSTAFAFSTGNTPIELNQGATLHSGHTGHIAILDNSTNHVGPGTLRWQADGCIEEALIARQTEYYADGSRITNSVIPLNGGQPF